MIPDSHLKEIIANYWDSEKKETKDHDFQDTALMAQMILDLRIVQKSVKKSSSWAGPR